VNSQKESSSVMFYLLSESMELALQILNEKDRKYCLQEYIQEMWIMEREFV
jgi:hypothetical protein